MGQQMDGCTTAVAANTIAVALASELSISDQNILGNFLTAVGASLLTIAAVNQTNLEQAGQTETSAGAETTAAAKNE